MRYKCLVLDHDDTIVNSTATVHYPCFVEYLKKYHPEKADKYTLEDYLLKNFDPGVISFFLDDVGLSREEFKFEERYWSEYVKSHVPAAYPGIAEIMEKFKKAGGILAIDSHSYRENIERDIKKNGLPTPDVIYGWDLPEEQRKPSPYTLLDLMKRYDLKPNEVLVVDDLKPGFDMARGAGVDFAAAGWAYDVPEISAFMRRHCDYYLESVCALYEILFV